VMTTVSSVLDRFGYAYPGIGFTGDERPAGTSVDGLVE